MRSCPGILNRERGQTQVGPEDMAEREGEVRRLYQFVAEQVMAGLYKADIIDKLIELGVDRFTADSLVEEMQERMRLLMDRRILLFLPRPVFRARLSKILKAAGYEVVSCTELDQILTLVKGVVPDLVIMEQHNEKGSALEALKLLRGHPIGRKVPVFVLTSRKNMQDAFLAFKLVGCLEGAMSAEAVTDQVKKILLLPQRYRV